MSSHHDHHDSHVNESKPVAFRTPLILALVTVLLILLAVSTCDGHHKSACDCSEPCTPECMKECESGDHSGHDAHATSSHSNESSHEENHDAAVASQPATDTLNQATQSSAIDSTAKATEHSSAH